MNTTTALKSVSLYFKEGSSDKEYHASIEASDGGYVVNFAYGRRGSTLTTGSKTQGPVEIEKATKIFDKLVSEKTAKGYSPKEGGVAFSGTENAGRVSGLQPQLLNPIDEAEVERLILDPDYCAQEKHNGERRMTKGADGVNRKGLLVAMPDATRQSVITLTGGAADLDAESIGEVLHVFDVVRIGNRDLAELPLGDRLKELDRLLAAASPEHFVAKVETAYTTAEKRALFSRVKARNGEGVVFKRLDAPYRPGRPNSGGSQFKYKFVDSASVQVIGHNDKRSVRMAVFGKDGAQVEVGNVTIPPSKPVPPIGAVIEVEYLYAHQGGSLFQPVYIGERADVEPEDCTAAQLKMKPAD